MEPPLNQWFNLYSQHHPKILLLLLSLVLSICFYRLLWFCGFFLSYWGGMFFHLLQINQWFFISIIFRTRNKSAGMIFRAQDESALQIYKQTGMYIAACFEQTCVLAPVKWILGFSCGCECWLFAVIYCDKKKEIRSPHSTFLFLSLFLLIQLSIQASFPSVVQSIDYSAVIYSVLAQRNWKPRNYRIQRLPLPPSS